VNLVFFGKYDHRLNAKNQVTVPARFRALLPEKEKLYLLRANDVPLYLYTQQDMEKIVGRMRESASAADPNFRRKFTSRVTPVDMDAQGRIVIPAELKKAAGIDADVVFIGNAERIEIWAADRWAAFDADDTIADGEAYDQKLDGMMGELFEK
jgi:MraZ protein